MVYNYVSSKAVIAKLYRDLKPSNPDFEANSMDWIGEALDFIGFIGPGVPRSKDLPVENNRTPLPPFLKEIRSVWYQGKKLTYGGQFLTNGKRSNEAVYMSSASTVLSQNNVEITRTGYAQVTPDITGDYWLLIPGYIQTSFESGTIKLKWTSKPVDEEGFPLVPDSPYFLQALEWYIMRQLILGGESIANFNFDYCDKQWKHYCAAAGNDAMYPDPNKMLQFRDRHVSMYVDPNAEMDEFNDLDLDNAPETTV